MPNGWVHATIDLIAFGQPYFDLHQKKVKTVQNKEEVFRIFETYREEIYSDPWHYNKRQVQNDPASVFLLA
jgi:hypothetical protein